MTVPVIVFLLILGIAAGAGVVATIVSAARDGYGARRRPRSSDDLCR